LEKILVTRLSGDDGGVAPPLFSERGELVKGHRYPMSGARVLMASLK
jgi:hypothetical protein